MTEGFKQQVPFIAVTGLLAIAIGTYALSSVREAAAQMDVGTFSTWIIVIPCVLMVAFSLVVMITASEIGRPIFITVVGLCFAAGIVSMIVTSAWMADPALASQLLANSPDGTSVTPPSDSPMTVIRNIAAYIVAPTVGSIAGAWIGSRLHPVKSSSASSRKGGRK